MSAGPAPDADLDRPKFTTVYLLFDADGALLRSSTVTGWDVSGWEAIEALDREAREIGGLLVPLHGVRDYRKTAT